MSNLVKVDLGAVSASARPAFGANKTASYFCAMASAAARVSACAFLFLEIDDPPDGNLLYNSCLCVRMQG